ncbi:E3 ubiquitin-protein ligase NRDP1-like isoform X3 [Adelges cooleyi]|uniref:E3 ubiquitin-protein ligase NRDP1-like isoform X3 n=1 Tax=Adelges cooleyi TaxID=133065 RepID=UPI0021803EF8|nr:E3 ubiquitin-protein ligase NRDP1-like isoform X3 [Adelges cooleyi]
MNWNIIFLLPCFTVLVNAGACNQPSRTYSPEQTGESSQIDDNTGEFSRLENNVYDSISEWKQQLVAEPTVNWDDLICFPKDVDKAAAESALTYSGCPTGKKIELLPTIHCAYWPVSIKSNQPPYYSKTNIRKLSLYRIPDTRVVYVATSERPVRVDSPGFLLTFSSL